MYILNSTFRILLITIVLGLCSSKMSAERINAIVQMEVYATASGDVAVNWIPSENVVSEYFSIERSNDGTVWWKIGEVHPLENITLTRAYSFIDETPMNGVSFYRVKSQMSDGERFNANPEMVFIEIEDKLKIIPDSKKRELNIYLKGSILKDAQLFGPSGMPIQVDFLKEPYAGKLDTKSLNPGKYNLSIITDKQTINRQIIII